MKNAVVVAKDVVKTFGQGDTLITAMDHLSLELYSSEMTLVKGPSGSGKSTLISSLGGLQRPNSGEVHVLGEAIWSKKEGELDDFRAKHCGFVFQSMGLFASLTAHEQIVLPLQYMGSDFKIASKIADELLEEVGLGHRRNNRPAQMSGGENQRVAIARMLAKEPKIIFADEPTSALDSKNGQIVADLLHRSAKLHDAMVLCVTHDDRLTGHADRILTIEDGKIFSDTRPAKQ
ncbi:ABC transporter ATP-binding protein [Parashewanella curva]|uniref:ABC transporter ATP-binding protein n=1 Tax=Parashewanella curva TaxID=2338552 RepID=A0A3L8PX35_9GAMM|nr:ABC transporter ATP-binding protein [Parashewanella curva]RLV59880.1 ABC transporter ATP-binding protein [Parashewanella curva]